MNHIHLNAFHLLIVATRLQGLGMRRSPKGLRRPVVSPSHPPSP